jgi:hypothetical protein
VVQCGVARPPYQPEAPARASDPSLASEGNPLPRLRFGLVYSLRPAGNCYLRRSEIEPRRRYPAGAPRILSAHRGALGLRGLIAATAEGAPFLILFACALCAAWSGIGEYSGLSGRSTKLIRSLSGFVIFVTAVQVSRGARSMKRTGRNDCPWLLEQTRSCGPEIARWPQDRRGKLIAPGYEVLP